jgi:hypothetical protein
MARNRLVNAMGRATIETVLQLSAEQVAGPPQQGRRRAGEIFWHGKQAGSVYLKERKLKVDKPRLRTKSGGAQAEVAVPAYEAMQDQTGMGSRMLDILLEGVSTRQYRAVIPKMADTVGVSKSSVSRAAIQASEAQLDRLLNRRFDDVDLLIIYIDGMHFGDQCVIGAVGVDEHGQKHVLGLQEGATENSAAHSGVRRRTRRVCRWRDKPMAKRWAAAAMLATEKNFRRVMGHKEMWALKAILDGKHEKDFHSERNHQSKGNVLLFPAQTTGTPCGSVRCLKRIGGLLRYYCRAA